MARPRSRPLKLSLREAWEIAKQLYRDYGGGAGRESLSTITDNSPTSSTFRYKVLALKSFSVIDERDDDVSLTHIGYGLAAPTDPDEAIRAAADAFLEVPEYREFHDRYAGKLLPDRDKLPNILHRELGLDKDYAEDWASSLLEDLETAKLLTRRGNQLLVLTSPETSQVRTQPHPGPAPTQAPPTTPVAPQTPERPLEGGQSMTISLSEGDATISIPKKITSADVKKLIGVITALGPPEDQAEGTA